ncbi:MAG: ABC transporter substrate-binding protein, partial [Chloroflexota bacterium]|nr:ABC transporter substrate-binding protein [Chloroflexota bacterium]
MPSITGLWVMVSLTLVLIVASCAPAATPTPAAPPVTSLAPTATPATVPTPAAVTPKYGGILKTNNRGDPAHLDLTQIKSYASVHPLIPVYSMLMQTEPKDATKLTTDLAEKWELSPDGKVYTFSLRNGVKFHDGNPLTSADVKYSFEHYRNPPKGVIIQLKTALDNVERIEAPDASTVKFTLKQPQGSFLEVTSAPFMVIYPKHLLEQDPNIMKKKVVGTGPFRLKDYNRGVNLELERNPDYFVNGRPYLDGVQRYIISDPAAIMSALRTQRIQF